ncbi:Hypothetical protein CINCED_3A005747 [Cinara cedri]|uniref:Tc1-like transposase DDE domain-containing protein n=1 Tax=Cinara cedri TaxID=506608 RepID=A0A5E4N5H7_9HEMI|nr:Hypothetical protein CINCED_3A005747 [Cinara cedri]
MQNPLHQCGSDRDYIENMISEICDVGFPGVTEATSLFWIAADDELWKRFYETSVLNAVLNMRFSEWRKDLVVRGEHTRQELVAADENLSKAADSLLKEQISQQEEMAAIDDRASTSLNYRLAKNKLDNVDDYNIESMRKIINKLAADFNYKYPNVLEVSDRARDNGIEYLSESCIRRIIRAYDLKYEMFYPVYKSKFEHRDTIVLRSKFLNRMCATNDLRPIIYIDEAFINQNLSSANSPEIIPKINSITKVPEFGRLIVFLAVSNKTGVVSKHIFRPSGGTAEYYRSQITNFRFKHWFVNLLNKLPESSVIVMDNSPYRSSLCDDKPLSGVADLAALRRWLRKEGTEYTVEQVSWRYELDTIAGKMEHEVVRLPRFHPDYSPVQTLWNKVKIEVSHENQTGDMENLRVIVNRAIMNIGTEMWQQCTQELTEKFFNDFLTESM